METTQEIRYLKSRREFRSDNQENVIHLYECGKYPDVLEIIDMCKRETTGKPEEYFFYLVFFDDKTNAGFSAHPATAYYGLEEGYLSHIKAIYEANRINGYSMLNFYESNAFNSPAQQIRID